jgi:hypothetical protein
VRDRGLVAFDRAPRRPLAGPSQLLAQNVPHMPRVIRGASHTLDHLRDPSQRPQVRHIPIGYRPSRQHGFDLSELLCAELRRSTGSHGGAQTVTSGASPCGTPVGDNLMRNTHLTRDLGWNHVLLKQIRGTHAALLERFKIAPLATAPSPFGDSLLWLGPDHTASLGPRRDYR